MSHNITIEGGTSVRLPTAGKYCDRDIVVTASGGKEDLDNVLTEQEELLATLKDTLNGKASGGGYDEGYMQGYAEAEAITTKVIEKTATEVHNDKATRIGTMVFRNSPIEVADFPNVTELGSYAFAGSSSLVTVNMPKLASVVKNAFESCTALTKLDFPKVTSIQAYAFGSCSKLTTLILRNTSRVVSLANVNALSTPLKTGDGYTYVPAALVDNYKAATNWSTYPDKIRAIEDYPEITGGAV